MAVLDNTIKAEDMADGLDVEFIRNFTHEVDRLSEVIGLHGVEVVPAGTALYLYKVTGSLSAESVEEGDEVPLSKYSVTREEVVEHTVKPYRKLTTAQAVLKSGFQNSVLRTDNQMVKDIRAGVLDGYFTYLAKGTGTATGEGLQATLAQMNAKLADTLEKNHDSADALVWFVNPYDIAGYLAKAEVTIQTVFGMQYLQTFLGVQNIFVTNKVEAKTVYVTPVENIHIYGVDFESLAQAGLTYETQESNIIGVHHAPAYNRTSCETYALVGCDMYAEILDFIVKGTITDPSEAV